MIEAEEKKMLYELLAGIAMLSIPELAAGFAITHRLSYVFGALLGIAIAVFMALHMYVTLKRAMLEGEAAAAKKMKFGTFLRMAVMFAGMLTAVLLPEVFSLVGVMLGILTLKLAALLQPLTNRLFDKILSKGR